MPRPASAVAAPSQALQERLRPLQLRKQLLLSLKLGGVYAAPAAAQPDRMLQVEHLVVNDIFHGVARNQELVKDAADHNRIVRRIVVADESCYCRPRRQKALLSAKAALPQAAIGDVLHGRFPAIPDAQ